MIRIFTKYTIFAPYLTKIVLRLEVQESIEKNKYVEEIQKASLKELRKIEFKILGHHYSEKTVSVLKEEIARREVICQKEIMEEMVENLELLNREQLISLKNKIEIRKIHPFLKEEYINKVEKQFDMVESNELQKLCSDIEKSDIDKLENIEQCIRKGKYQKKFSSQYLNIIEKRIEYLHVRNMEYYCSNMEGASKKTLNSIKQKIDEEACRKELKNKFYELIQEHIERAEYKELEILMGELNQKTLTELKILYIDVLNGRYTSKYINYFASKIRRVLEKKEYNLVKEKILEINSLSKESILNLKAEIIRYDFEQRISKLAIEKIGSRLYQLDLQELIAMQNEFDSLSFSDIMLLYQKMDQKDLCESSKITYKRKLEQREWVLAYQKVNDRIVFIKQILEQRGMNDINIKMPILSNDYQKYFGMYISKGGKKDYKNIPLVIFPNIEMLTVTESDIYYDSNGDYKRVKISDVRSFEVEKTLLIYSTVMILVDGTKETIAIEFNKKKAYNIAASLMTILEIRNSTNIPRQNNQYFVHIEPFNVNMKTENLEKDISDIYIERLLIDDIEKNSLVSKLPGIKYCGLSNWTRLEEKAKSGMEIERNVRLVLYYDRTILESAKDGFALGINGVYIKNGNQKLIFIPLDSITAICHQNDQLKIETVSNNIYYTPIQLNKENSLEVLSHIMDSYIKGIQLLRDLNLLRNETFRNTEKKQYMGNDCFLICPNCKATIRKGDKFCFKCGSKIEQDKVRFCKQCGAMVSKEDNFCTNCGERLK